MTPEQCGGARYMLRLTISDLSEVAGVGRNAISRFESTGRAHVATVEKIKAALEAAGAEFKPEGWVRVRRQHQPPPTVLPTGAPPASARASR